MKWLKNPFGRYEKAQCAPIPPKPDWEKIVELMYDKGLDAFEDELIQVFYSKDKTMRYVILKDKKGIFTYQLEQIYQFDEDEWKYTYEDENTLPAMWETAASQCGGSLFANEEDLMHDLKSQHEYKQYFN